MARAHLCVKWKTLPANLKEEMQSIVSTALAKLEGKMPQASQFQYAIAA